MRFQIHKGIFSFCGSLKRTVQISKNEFGKSFHADFDFKCSPHFNYCNTMSFCQKWHSDWAGEARDGAVWVGHGWAGHQSQVSCLMNNLYQFILSYHFQSQAHLEHPHRVWALPAVHPSSKENQGLLKEDHFSSLHTRSDSTQRDGNGHKSRRHQGHLYPGHLCH